MAGPTIFQGASDMIEGSLSHADRPLGAAPELASTPQTSLEALGDSTLRTMARWMVLSGAAALLYEVVLQKLFSYLLGASLLSATITIASYMVGFSLGALLLGRSSA